MALPSEINILSICSGGGGLDVGLRLAIPRARTVGYVEREGPAVAALVAAMEAGTLDAGPVWSDASTFDGRPWRGVVDCVAGGTPCQDLSLAGKREGIHGERSGLFFEFVRIVREVQPALVFWENVGGAATALPAVFAAFEREGYSGAWARVRASDVGATHSRARVFLLGHRDGHGLEGERSQRGIEAGRVEVSDADGHGGARTSLGFAHRQGLEERGVVRRDGGEELSATGGTSLAGLPLWPPGPTDTEGWRRVLATHPHLAPALPKSTFRGVADGLALASGGARIDALRLLGNGVVPEQAAAAFQLLAGHLGLTP